MAQACNGERERERERDHSNMQPYTIETEEVDIHRLGQCEASLLPKQTLHAHKNLLFYLGKFFYVKGMFLTSPENMKMFLVNLEIL